MCCRLLVPKRNSKKPRMNEFDLTTAVEKVVRDRKTIKLLADSPIDSTVETEVMESIVACAGFAPFHLAAAVVHRERVDNETLVPWRFYMVDKENCSKLRNAILESGDVTKVPNMLAAASCLIQVTWCPDPPEEGFEVSEESRFQPTEANMEHIAATAAAVQNLLLAATARNINTYWSSGGVLKTKWAFDKMGIPDDQILLGSVFVFPDPSIDQSIDSKPGKMRDKRGEDSHWSRWVYV